jgi:hypothetical protein
VDPKDIPPAVIGYDFTQRKAARIARQRKAFELASQGWKFRDIAAEIGVKTHSYVSKLIAAESALPGPGTAAARSIECAKLDERERLQRTMLAQQMEERTNPETGKVQKVISPEALEKFDQAMTRIATHRSKIMGLDAPIKISEAMSQEWNEVLDDLQRNADPETYERVLGIIARRQEDGPGAAQGAQARQGQGRAH